MSPTITTPAMTQAGMILGTAAYMSPEQARGTAVDKRTDIWAFGAVLFEMVTRKRAFPEEDTTDTIVSIVSKEPDWSALPASTPAGFRRLLNRCLKKTPMARMRDIGEARLQIVDLLSGGSEEMGPAASDFRAAPNATTRATEPMSAVRRRTVWTYALLVAAALIGAAGVGTLVWTLKPAAARPVGRFAITLPPGHQLTIGRPAIAISPDGKQLAYSADGRVYVRSMSELEPRAIAGTDGAEDPVFAPDGQSLVFWADATLKRIAVSGGAAVTICAANAAPDDIAWPSDAILFSQPGIGIMRVSANGGKPDVMVGLKTTERVMSPQLLPDGRSVLLTVTAATGSNPSTRSQIVVQSLVTGERKTLIEGGSDARFVPTGHIVYVAGGTLYAAPFDLATLAVAAGRVPIVESVRRAVGVSGAANYAFSSSGSLIYVPGPTSSKQQDLMLFDRKGGAQALKLPPGSYEFPRVSPDGKRIAFQTSDGNEAIISIYELSGASSVRRLTFEGDNRFPIWADNQHVAFQSDREGDSAVFWQPADGGVAERLTTPEPGTSHVPESWSPNGDALLFRSTKGPNTSLFVFSLQDRKAMPFDDVRGSALPTDAMFSPDGRWVAYQTGDAVGGEGTTFVQPFPPNGTKYQIVAGGGRPMWSRDGRELFYIPGPGRFMAVTVRTQPTFTFTPPAPVPRGFVVAVPAASRPFDITPDGRILGVGAAGQSPVASRAEIHVVLNWFTELQQRVPTR